MKKIFGVVLIILSTMIWLGCTNSSQESGTSNNKQATTIVTLGLSSAKASELRKNASKIIPGSKSNYVVEENDKFKGSIYISNESLRKRQFMVISLLDYKQVDIRLDGKLSKKHLVELKANQIKYFDFEGPVINKGSHDFLILSFWSPNNHSIDGKTREETRGVFNDTRVNFVTNSKHKTLRYYTKLLAQYSDNVSGGLMLNTINDPKVLEAVKIIKPGAEVSFTLHLSNPTNNKLRYAVSAFLDYKQIIINKEHAHYVEILPHKRIAISEKVNVPDKNGKYELLFLATLNPFEKAFNKQETAFESASSNRLVVSVE